MRLSSGGGRIYPLYRERTKNPFFWLQQNFFWKTFSIPDTNSETFFWLPFGIVPWIIRSPLQKTLILLDCLASSSKKSLSTSGSLRVISNKLTQYFWLTWRPLQKNHSGRLLKWLTELWASVVVPTLVNSFCGFRRCHKGAF